MRVCVRSATFASNRRSPSFESSQSALRSHPRAAKFCYRSTDTTITTSDTEVGTDTVGVLSAGATTSTMSVTVTAPSSAGTYRYGACVDAVTGESDTTNNCSGSVSVVVSESPPQTNPDLAVGSPTVSDSSPTTGATFTLSATVQNDGDGPSAATTLRYYRSTDGTITSADTEVGTDAVGGLAAGATSAESISLTAPSSAGTYYYGACVDEVTDESDTTNNCSSAVSVIVSAAPPPTNPDLEVQSPSVNDSSLDTGASFTLSATVRNDSDGAAAATTLRYYRSTDGTITSADTEVGTDAVGGLAAGATSPESISRHALRRGTRPSGHWTISSPTPRTTPSTVSNGWTASSGSGRTTRPSRSSTSIRNRTARST